MPKIYNITFLISSMLLGFLDITNARLLGLNGEPKLSVPTEALLTSASSEKFEYEYTIDGITFANPKATQTDAVRVDLMAYLKTGSLRLNEENKFLADFKNCTLRRYSDWKCRGDGRGKDMTFIANPSNLDRILSNLVFEAYSSKAEDQIIIRVYYGEGGDCLSSEEQKNEITNNRCIKTQGVVRIRAATNAKVAPGSEVSFEASSTSWHDTIVRFVQKHSIQLVVIGAIILIMIFISLIARYFRKKCTGRRVSKEPVISGASMNV
mmetsp:Transcript_29393/g.44511  ORF Transcript_29393/g.44511 Transcript_29393/m.44511 type:complete len:266 (+) Transcript_29393:316-1113(+)